MRGRAHRTLRRVHGISVKMGTGYPVNSTGYPVNNTGFPLNICSRWYFHVCCSYPGGKSVGKNKNVVGKSWSYRERLYFSNLPVHFFIVAPLWKNVRIDVFVIARGSSRAWQVDINKGHKEFTRESDGYFTSFPELVSRCFLFCTGSHVTALLDEGIWG